jgi:hypothetical protein
MPYRDPDPLELEETALAGELASLEKRQRELRHALDDAREKRRTARTLPMLDNVRVAAPCTARWEEMRGDDQVRFCGACAKNVYDLSSLTREAAEELLASKGEAPCVRFYRRYDGTILTQDCAVGVRRRRVKRAVGVAVGMGGVAALAAAGLASMSMGKPSMGAIAPTSAQLEEQRARVGAMEQGEVSAYVVSPPGPPAQATQTVTPSSPRARRSTPRR